MSCFSADVTEDIGLGRVGLLKGLDHGLEKESREGSGVVDLEEFGDDTREGRLKEPVEVIGSW